MTQFARRASLVVVLLFGPVATTSAECAWVLWNDSMGEKLFSAPSSKRASRGAKGAR